VEIFFAEHVDEITISGETSGFSGKAGNNEMGQKIQAEGVSESGSQLGQKSINMPNVPRPPDNTFAPSGGDTTKRQVTDDTITEVDEFVDANEHGTSESSDAEMEVVPETPSSIN
jgi:hypothetical protein